MKQEIKENEEGCFNCIHKEKWAAMVECKKINEIINESIIFTGIKKPRIYVDCLDRCGFYKKGEL